LRPASRSSRANFSTTGVLPVPPTVRLPMAMTWTPRVLSRKMRMFVKPAADFDGDLEQFRAAEQKTAHQHRLGVVSFPEDDFEGKGFEAFRPNPEFFAHVASVCQVISLAARIGSLNWRTKTDDDCAWKMTNS